MKIIIGLGNPGTEYKKTRHNAGFLFVDALRTFYDFPDFTHNSTFDALLSEGFSPQKTKIILVKPQKFMNLSGCTVSTIMNYYKISHEDLIIAHDDLDIEIGNYKISHNIRAAGHNGVQNIIELLDTQEFTRIRIGIERVGGKKERGEISGKNFVLQNFTPQELSDIQKNFEDIISQFIQNESLYQK